MDPLANDRQFANSHLRGDRDEELFAKGKTPTTTALVPAESVPLAARPAVTSTAVVPASQSPVLAIQRLKPFSVIDTGKETLYYYLKIGAKGGSTRCLDPEVARQCALIAVNQAAGTFRLQWWPWADKPEFHANLTVDQLPTVVADLVAAGFPVETGR